MQYSFLPKEFSKLWTTVLYHCIEETLAFETLRKSLCQEIADLWHGTSMTSDSIETALHFSNFVKSRTFGEIVLALCENFLFLYKGQKHGLLIR